MSPDLKLTYRILLAMLLLAEALALAGVMRGPHSLWLAELSVANIGTYALFVVVLYAFSRPPSAEAGRVATAGAALAVVALYIEYRSIPVRPMWDWIFVACTGFGAAALAALIIRLKRGSGDRALARDLLAASGLAPLADPTISAYLHLTTALHPATFDVGAYLFDAALGFQPSAVLALLIAQAPLVKDLVATSYHFQPYGISLLYVMQRVAHHPRGFSIIAFQAVSALMSALVLYHLYPVAGPAYLFGAAFPAYLPDAATLTEARTVVATGARNGVPSMHFAWALALWLGARQLGVRWLEILFALWLGATFVATLGLGEHYLVDLVVAVPLVIGVLGLCMFGIPWSRERARAVCGGLGLTLAWIGVLRFAPGVLTGIPGVAWIAMAATVIASALLYRGLERMLEPVPSSRVAAAVPAVRGLTAAAWLRPMMGSIPSDLRLALGLFLAGLVVAELVALTGIVPAPHAQLIGIADSPHIALALAALSPTFCILYVFSRPGWREFVPVAAASALIAALYVVAGSTPRSLSPSTVITIVTGAFTVCAMAALVIRIGRAPSQRPLAIALVGAFVLYASYNVLATSFLALTAALHPRTFDALAFNLDRTLGFDPSIAMALVASHWPTLLDVVTTAYVYMPFGFAALYGLQLLRPQHAPVSVLMAFTVSGVAALLLYNLCPVAGPRYAFGDQFFASGVKAPSELITVMPAARNGVPSMHFGWALLMWMHASHFGPVVRAAFGVLAGLVFVATLATGEHYLVDLIAAVPLIVAMQALCAGVLGWERTERRRAFITGALLTAGWMVVIRYGVALFTAVPGLTWAAMIATVAACVWAYLPLARALRGQPAGVLRETVPQAPTGVAARYVGWMFVLSGFAALVYQVLFSKALALTFGSQATATYTVLTVYMGGMALGAWLGGRLVARHRDPLKLYAWCELGIGAYCLATPAIFHGVQLLYTAAAAGMLPDAGALTLFRVVLGSAALAAPTVLMGATLPILARFLEGRSASLGVSVALLYGANTIGAAAGALLAGYMIIPALGVWKTTLLAAALNFFVVWLAFKLQRSVGPAAVPAGDPYSPALRPASSEAAREGRLALAVLAVGGVVTLALEVDYIHLLAVVAGNSVYAFSLMLFAFLLGLGAGAAVARRLLRLDFPLLLMLAWLEFALAGVILAGIHLWEALPAYFASFESYPLTRGFGARELVRGLVCLLAMLPPALVIGAIYPIAMECVGRAHPAAPAAALGRAAALNTAGNIVGVLGAGFWLLPVIGALRSVQLLALISLALGAVVIACAGRQRRAVYWAPAVLVLALLATQPRSFDYTALASGANVYFETQYFGRVIDHAESADGGLTTVSAVTEPGREGLRVLQTNGKFQGTNDLKGEGVAQAGIALSPLMHSAARRSALVIGYGTGMSARVLHDAGFEELEIVDLSADIVRLADEHFGDVNGQVTSRRGVRTYITDGRNFLLLQDRRYDLVSMEISSIWFAGAASLYNREFYQLVKRRLDSDGVLQQWIQLHHIYPRDLAYVLGSVRSEFRHVWVYEIGGQGIIIASNSRAAAPRPEYVEKMDRTPALGPVLEMHGGSVARLGKTRLLDPEGVDRLLAGFKLPASYWVSTDDNLYLEYSTPRGNILDGTRSFLGNTQFLRSAGGAPADVK